tara:strand:+ start:194 stop:604 length:411 start_codon:yes stop_codon:yes gene_type:complete
LIITRRLYKIISIFLIGILFFSCKSNKEEPKKISKNDVSLKKTSSLENIKKDSLLIDSTKNNIELNFEKDAYEAASCMCKFSNLINTFSKDKSKEIQIKLENTSKQCTSLFNKVDSLYSGDENFKELYVKYVAECE